MESETIEKKEALQELKVLLQEEKKEVSCETLHNVCGSHTKYVGK